MVSPAASLPESAISIPEPHEARIQPVDNGRSTPETNVGQMERAISIMLGSLMVAKGLSRLSLMGLGVAAGGAALIQRGATGQCKLYSALNVSSSNDNQSATPLKKIFSHPLHQSIHVEKSVMVQKPVAEVFAFWRKLENLPRFMDHLESVKEMDGKRSHWVAKAPRGKRVEWNADIVSEELHKRLAWKSVEGADVPNAGQVLFESMCEGQATRVKVILAYDPPAGILGALFAKLFGEEPNQTVGDDLRHFKQIMEAGETPTTDGQPKGKC